MVGLGWVGLVGMGKLDQTTQIVAAPGHLVFTCTHKVCAARVLQRESLGTRASINWPVVRPGKGP